MFRKKTLEHNDLWHKYFVRHGGSLWPFEVRSNSGKVTGWSLRSLQLHFSYDLKLKFHDSSFPREILARMSRGCYAENGPVEFKLNAARCPHGECVHCWRHLAKKTKKWRKIRKGLLRDHTAVMALSCAFASPAGLVVNAETPLLWIWSLYTTVQRQLVDNKATSCRPRPTIYRTDGVWVKSADGATSVVSTHASGSWYLSRVISGICDLECLCACPCSKWKTTWAINTKQAWYTYRPTLWPALTWLDSKVKVQGSRVTKRSRMHNY